MIFKSKLLGVCLLVAVGWVGMRSLYGGKSQESWGLAPVSAILKELNIPHELTLESMNAACQKNLLRKVGAERWQMENFCEEKRAVLMPYIRELGLDNEVQLTAELAAYDYILFLGATTERTYDRISYIREQLKALSGTHKPLVVLLTGMRPLDPLHEDMSYGSTEAEMMEAIYKTLGLADVPYLVVNVPMRGAARPTTDDTVYAWLATGPKPGRCLAVSSQPFVKRQGDVLRALLPQGFRVDVIGQAPRADYTVALYLDELARTVYQTKQLAEKIK